MSKRWVGIFVSVVLLGWATGCDSSNEGDSGRSDAEILVGSWTLTNLLLDGQDVSALLLAGNAVEAVFENNGSFTLSVTDAQGMEMTITGTYQLAESQQMLTLNSDGFSQAVMIAYELESDNRIQMNTDQVELLTELSGINLEDLGLQVQTVTLVVQRKN